MASRRTRRAPQGDSSAVVVGGGVPADSLSLNAGHAVSAERGGAEKSTLDFLRALRTGRNGAVNGFVATSVDGIAARYDALFLRAAKGKAADVNETDINQALAFLKELPYVEELEFAKSTERSDEHTTHLRSLCNLKSAYQRFTGVVLTRQATLILAKIRQAGRELTGDEVTELAKAVNKDTEKVFGKSLPERDTLRYGITNCRAKTSGFNQLYTFCIALNKHGVPTTVFEDMHPDLAKGKWMAQVMELLPVIMHPGLAALTKVAGQLHETLQDKLKALQDKLKAFMNSEFDLLNWFVPQQLNPNAADPNDSTLDVNNFVEIFAANVAGIVTGIPDLQTKVGTGGGGLKTEHSHTSAEAVWWLLALVHRMEATAPTCSLGGVYIAVPGPMAGTDQFL